MDCNKTINFIAELNRLCDSRVMCDDVADKERCPMFGFCGEALTKICVEDVKTAIETVQKWSDERPKKTYAQDFFEKFPKAPKDELLKGRCPYTCRRSIYAGKCPGVGCDECWNEPMEE